MTGSAGEGGGESGGDQQTRPDYAEAVRRLGQILDGFAADALAARQFEQMRASLGRAAVETQVTDPEQPAALVAGLEAPELATTEWQPLQPGEEYARLNAVTRAQFEAELEGASVGTHAALLLLASPGTSWTARLLADAIAQGPADKGRIASVITAVSRPLPASGFAQTMAAAGHVVERGSVPNPRAGESGQRPELVVYRAMPIRSVEAGPEPAVSE